MRLLHARLIFVLSLSFLFLHFPCGYSSSPQEDIVHLWKNLRLDADVQKRLSAHEEREVLDISEEDPVKMDVPSSTHDSIYFNDPESRSILFDYRNLPFPPLHYSSPMLITVSHSLPMEDVSPFGNIPKANDDQALTFREFLHKSLTETDIGNWQSIDEEDGEPGIAEVADLIRKYETKELFHRVNDKDELIPTVSKLEFENMLFLVVGRLNGSINMIKGIRNYFLHRNSEAVGLIKRFVIQFFPLIEDHPEKAVKELSKTMGDIRDKGIKQCFQKAKPSTLSLGLACKKSSSTKTTSFLEEYPAEKLVSTIVYHYHTSINSIAPKHVIDFVTRKSSDNPLKSLKGFNDKITYWLLRSFKETQDHALCFKKVRDMAKIFYKKKQLEPLLAITLFYQLTDIGKFDKEYEIYEELFRPTNGHENVRAMMDKGKHDLPLLSVIARNLDKLQGCNACVEDNEEVYLQTIHGIWLALKQLYNSNSDFKNRCSPHMWDRMPSLLLDRKLYYNKHLIDEIAQVSLEDDWTVELLDYGKSLRKALEAAL